MDTAIKMPLRSLNPLVIKDLQDKHPSAAVHIEVDRKMEGRAMDEQSFWDIIALLIGDINKMKTSPLLRFTH